MFDPRGNDTGGDRRKPTGTNFNQNSKDFLTTGPRPAEYDHAVHRKMAKELLLPRREDDDNFSRSFKRAKSGDLAGDLNPRPSGPSGPDNSDIMNHFLAAAPGNGHISPQQVAPTAEMEMTLLHWQIQRETRRVAGISPEQLHVQDDDGDTFLHIAVAQGRRALANTLAAKMAHFGSLDMKEHNGQTALQIAAATNQQFIVYDLLTLGAQVNVQDLWGRSPLHTCAEKGHFLSLQSIWRALTESRQPLDIEKFNYDGSTPLHAAVLAHNAAVKELRSLGNLSTHTAKELEQRKQMYVGCVRTLLLMGASCGTKDLKSGMTPLHMASAEANVELLHILLDHPSSLSLINARTFSGHTALHIVSSLKNPKNQATAVTMLMRKGADPGARNFEKELPRQLVPEGAVGEQVRQILKGKYYHA